MTNAERDLAEAIYQEIDSDVSAARAALTWADTKDMRHTLLQAATCAIEAVLARRPREATRAPSPWDGGHHFQEEDGYPGSLLPRKRGTP